MCSWFFLEFRTYFSTCDPDYFFIGTRFWFSSNCHVTICFYDSSNGYWISKWNMGRFIWKKTNLYGSCCYIVLFLFIDRVFQWSLYSYFIRLCIIWIKRCIEVGNAGSRSGFRIWKRTTGHKRLFSSIILCNEYFFNSRRFAGKFILWENA